YDGLLAFYQNALTQNPNVRLLLLTHIGHRTGLMVPVKEITAMARKMNVDVIVDVAHSFGQIDINIADIGADFVGFNLHKWIGAPIGAGAMYIKKERLADISPNPSAEGDELQHIWGRVHTGTVNFATMLTLPAAFAYHNQVGGPNIEARLRYLRDLWVEQVKDLQNLQVLTPQDQRLHAGITSFRLQGKTSVKDNKAIVEQLLERYKIFTTHRDGVANGACVRVTPSLYTSADDINKFATALRQIAKT
ncbi:Cysteine desulfurase, partial [hydrothermal vent metagenome]